MSGASQSLNFEANDKKLEDILFSNYKYVVPRYQRPYTWTEDQAADFWTDLIDGSSSYFIGSIVLNYAFQSRDNIIEIIDGQQRFLTATIFMAVIRDIADKVIFNRDMANRIQNKCIAFEDRRGRQTYRIVPGDSTKAFFESNIQKFPSDIDIILSSIDDSKKKGSKRKSRKFYYQKEEKKIFTNYRYFKNQIENELDSDNYKSKEEKTEYLQSLWDRIATIKAIWIKIESEEDAYEIFETVNARGVDLSIADLLKNLIFKNIPSTAVNTKDKVKDKWALIEDNIKETNMDMSKFLRYYWLSKYSFITEKKLYKEIKKEVKDYKKFLNELHDASKWFFKLLKGSIDDWKDIPQGKTIYKRLEGIRLMGVTQCYVLFLSLMRNRDKIKHKLSSIFGIVENFTFIYSTISNLPGNKVEKIYSRYAIEIENATALEDKTRINKMNSIFLKIESSLISIKPQYEHFKAGFMGIAYKNNEKTRKIIGYVLSNINSYYEKTDELIIDFLKVNIEHIYPQKPSKECREQHKHVKNIQKLGNLTLLSKKLNEKMKNKPIKGKMDELKKSQLAITKKLVKKLEANNCSWSDKEIEERQEELARIAYEEVWKI
jgi:uncharacterized protein with ParB-like and HNH nuclease domain